MRFKTILILTLCTVFISGCELPLNEDPPPVEAIEIDLGGKTKCLSNLNPVITQYLDGVAQEPQIVAAWDCLKTAITTFEETVQGRDEDRFTAREVAHSLEQYHLDEGTRIPDALLIESFRVKQLLVGGSINFITRSEMTSLLSVLDILKGVTLNLNPYIRIYSMDWTPEEVRRNPSQFENANSTLLGSLETVSSLIEKNGATYQLENAFALLREVVAFRNGNMAWVADAEKALPVLRKLKKSLTGGDESQIAATEWRQFASIGARGYMIYLRFHYFIQGTDPLSDSAALKPLADSLGELFRFVGEAIDRKPSRSLSQEEIVEIAQELSDFTSTLKVSELLVSEFMKFKPALFGGNPQKFVKADFDRGQQKLEPLREVISQFLENRSIYSLEWKPSDLASAETQAQFDRADQGLVALASKLGFLFEGAYDLQNLNRLAAELDRLYEFQLIQDQPLAETVRTYLPVLISFKKIVLSDTDSIVGKVRSSGALSAPQQWSQFLEIAAGVYGRYLSYEYFLKEKKWTAVDGLFGLQKTVDGAIVLLEKVITKKSVSLLSHAELDALLDTLSDSKILPDFLSVKTLKHLSRVLVQKILVEPKNRLEQNVPRGLAISSLKVLRSEFIVWADAQRVMAQSFQPVSLETGKPGAELISALAGAPASVGVTELKIILSTPLPLSFDGVGRWYLSKPELNYRANTVDMINLIRTGARLLIRSYAMDLERIQNYTGLTEAEVETAFQDFKGTAVELDLIAADNHEFAVDRFRDANLFTSVGNGDELADFQEMSVLFVMIFSGKKIDALMFEKLEKACPLNKPSVSQLDWTANVDCVTELYGQEMKNVFVSMPDFLNYQASLPPDQIKAFFINLLKASGAVLGEDKMVKMEDLGLYPHIVQYVEGIFQLRDTSREGLLQTTEAMAAYPTYRTILKKVSGLGSEEQLRGLFSWLLKKGKPPETFPEKAQFLAWCKKSEDSWDLQADRQVLGKILGFIADALNKQETQPAPIAEPATPAPTPAPTPEPAPAAEPTPAPTVADPVQPPPATEESTAA